MFLNLYIKKTQLKTKRKIITFECNITKMLFFPSSPTSVLKTVLGMSCQMNYNF